MKTKLAQKIQSEPSKEKNSFLKTKGRSDILDDLLRFSNFIELQLKNFHARNNVRNWAKNQVCFTQKQNSNKKGSILNSNINYALKSKANQTNHLNIPLLLGSIVKPSCASAFWCVFHICLGDFLEKTFFLELRGDFLIT